MVPYEVQFLCSVHTPEVVGQALQAAWQGFDIFRRFFEGVASIKSGGHGVLAMGC